MKSSRLDFCIKWKIVQNESRLGRVQSFITARRYAIAQYTPWPCVYPSDRHKSKRVLSKRLNILPRKQFHNSVGTLTPKTLVKIRRGSKNCFLTSPVFSCPEVVLPKICVHPPRWSCRRLSSGASIVSCVTLTAHRRNWTKLNWQFAIIINTIRSSSVQFSRNGVNEP